MSSFDFDVEIQKHLDVLRSLQKPTGVFTASAHDVQTGYDKAWLRDIYFMTLGFLETGDLPVAQKAAKAFLTLFVKHKDKINWAIEHKPHEAWQYIHARFHPETLRNIGKSGGTVRTMQLAKYLTWLLSLNSVGRV